MIRMRFTARPSFRATAPQLSYTRMQEGRRTGAELPCEKEEREKRELWKLAVAAAPEPNSVSGAQPEIVGTAGDGHGHTDGLGQPPRVPLPAMPAGHHAAAHVIEHQW